MPWTLSVYLQGEYMYFSVNICKTSPYVSSQFINMENSLLHLQLGVDPQFNSCWTFILVIEQLPVELRDRFTDMREMDLQVQSKFYIHNKKDCVLTHF